jgi:hypothetical protein
MKDIIRPTRMLAQATTSFADRLCFPAWEILARLYFKTPVPIQWGPLGRCAPERAS